MVVYASTTSKTYTYSNKYVMEYSLSVTGSTSSSAGAAITSTDNEAVAFASLFGYNSSGTAVCSGSVYQDAYVYITKAGKKAVKYTSYHSLVDENHKPYGSSKSITKYTS